MVIVWEDVNIGPHLFHNHHEPLKLGINRLTGEMSEVLILSLVSRIQSCLNISIPNMSIL
jgi:hypothetical protein